MFTTDLINTVNSGNGSRTPPTKGMQMDQEDFIKLLLTQMKLQTPQNPFDSNTMMQQMAQMTNLSASHNMELAVKSLNTNLGATQVLSASQLVGKKVQVVNEMGSLVEGKGLQGSVVLPKDVDKVTVTIRDLNDKVVKEIEMGASTNGVVDFDWNGLDASGNPCASGFYKLSASAVVGGVTAAIPTAGAFTVNSVALGRNGEGVILNLDGVGGVNMSDLIKIM